MALSSIQFRSDYRTAMTAGSSLGSKTNPRARARIPRPSPRTLRRPSPPRACRAPAQRTGSRPRPDRSVMPALQVPWRAAVLSSAVARELRRDADGRPGSAVRAEPASAQEQAATMAAALRMRAKHARRCAVRFWCTAAHRSLPDHAVGRDQEACAGTGGVPDRLGDRGGGGGAASGRGLRPRVPDSLGRPNGEGICPQGPAELYATRAQSASITGRRRAAPVASGRGTAVRRGPGAARGTGARAMPALAGEIRGLAAGPLS